MTDVVTRRSTCRLCKSPAVERVVQLEPIPLSENYAKDPNIARAVERFPVDVYMCGNCGHVQHLDVIDPAFLWRSYTYFSGQARGMPEHFQAVADDILARVATPADALVIDIGSNDGSLLKPFQATGRRVLGVDPAEEAVRRANADGVPTIEALMSREVARRVRDEHGPAHIICAFNVFAHADDLGEMVDCVRQLLAPDGVFIFEAQYLADIIDGVLIATIFHEHMSHHSVKPLVGFLERHGLALVDAKRAPIQHGSLIGYVHLAEEAPARSDALEALIAAETARGLDKIETLRAFDVEIQRLRRQTAALAERWRADDAVIAGYGAARSGPTLMAQLGLRDAIDFIVDDHPQKVGLYASGDGVPILPTAELLVRMPAYTVILAWVHAAKIIETNAEYLRRGGRFVVLCPETRVVGAEGDIPIERFFDDA